MLRSGRWYWEKIFNGRWFMVNIPDFSFPIWYWEFFPGRQSFQTLSGAKTLCRSISHQLIPVLYQAISYPYCSHSPSKIDIVEHLLFLCPNYDHLCIDVIGTFSPPDGGPLTLSHFIHGKGDLKILNLFLNHVWKTTHSH